MDLGEMSRRVGDEGKILRRHTRCCDALAHPTSENRRRALQFAVAADAFAQPLVPEAIGQRHTASTPGHDGPSRTRWAQDIRRATALLARGCATVRQNGSVGGRYHGAPLDRRYSSTHPTPNSLLRQRIMSATHTLLWRSCITKYNCVGPTAKSGRYDGRVRSGNERITRDRPPDADTAYISACPRAS